MAVTIVLDFRAFASAVLAVSRASEALTAHARSPGRNETFHDATEFHTTAGRGSVSIGGCGSGHLMPARLASRLP